MKEYIQCNGNNLPDYPEKLQPKDVKIYIHDSQMIFTHDYSCPVCLKNSAVYSAQNGIMQPCWDCQDKGYQIIKKELTVIDTFKKWCKCVLA